MKIITLGKFERGIDALWLKIKGLVSAEASARTSADNVLQGEIDVLAERIEEIDDFTPEAIKPTTTNFEQGTPYSIDEAFQRTADLFGGYQGEIDAINAKIPNQASTQNQLADKAFVNSTVATNAANFRGNWSTWANVPTDSSLYPQDYTGSRTPTNNDYMVVNDASEAPGEFSNFFTIKRTAYRVYDVIVNGITTSVTFENMVWVYLGENEQIKAWRNNSGLFQFYANKPVKYNEAIYNIGELVFEENGWNPIVAYNIFYSSQLSGIWRFMYVGDWSVKGKSGWNPQYRVGSAFTAAQQAAIDSGITATKVAQYDGYNSSITALQTDKLDKVYSSGKKVYGVAADGSQKMYTAGGDISMTEAGVIETAHQYTVKSTIIDPLS